MADGGVHVRIDSSHGLRTAVVDAAEAAETEWESTGAGIDVVRVVDPDPVSWPALRRAGFAIMPACVTWISPVGASDEDFLGRLSSDEGRNIRQGQRFAADRGIRLDVRAPLDAEAFDAFLDLYVRQVGAMRHGVPFAQWQRDGILAEADDYLLVRALDGDGALVGGCVCLWRRDVSALQIRFASATPDARRGGLIRAMYQRVFQEARDLGCATVSLGTDPSIYGHIAKPGLFRFKSRLGFTPVAARIFGSDDDPDEANRVLRLDALSEPSLLLSYDLPEGAGTDDITADTALRMDVLTRDGDVDTAFYRAGFLTEVDIRKIP
jgi:GNAT superfamily N-acetyltransferase